MSKPKRVVHLCLTGPFSDGFTYQDNLLSKYHKRMGFETILIAPKYRHAKNGGVEYFDKADYENEFGVRVIRLDNDQNRPVTYRFRTYKQLSSLLEELHPDYLFVHGCQFIDAKTVSKYMKNNSDTTKMFVDNHSDDSNSAQNWISRHILHRIIWKHYARLLVPYAEKFWGVLPARVDFLVENYGIPSELCDLLVMGADDEEVARASNEQLRRKTRSCFGASDDDFLIVTGGKIDRWKTETLDLMRAVCSLQIESVRLLVFGPVVDEIRDDFMELAKHERISYVPWANTEESYDYLYAADLAVFPGRHSVYWEEAAGLGVPMLVKRRKGFTHIDKGNNVAYLYSSDEEEIREAIEKIMDQGMYGKMKSSAQESAEEFRYSVIGKKALGLY